LPWVKSPGASTQKRILGTTVSDWKDALPFALTWFAAMLLLFYAFSAVDILLTTILQCTRGFLTIVLAYVVMHWGHHHIEPKMPRWILVQRLAAGVLMFVGISLYVVKDVGRLGAVFSH